MKRDVRKNVCENWSHHMDFNAGMKLMRFFLLPLSSGLLLQLSRAETPCGVGENILRLLRLRLAEQLQQQQKFGVYQSECPGNWLENCHTKGQHVSLHHYRVSSTIVIDCPLSTQLSQPHNNPYLHRFTLLFSACEMALLKIFS